MDRYVETTRDNPGAFILDGERYEVYEAKEYLVSQGFSETDAATYLRGLRGKKK